LTGNSTALQRRAAAELEGKRKRKLPWERKGLSRVERVIAFLEYLPITKGILIGKKLRLLPNQRRFIERVYGSTEVRIAVRSEPRGNGKTGLVSGLALCHLLGPEAEERGECYSAAVNRLQSSLMHGEMSAIIERIPEFASRVNIRRGGQRRCIEVISGPGVGSVYEAMSADARRGHGLAPSWWAYDELAQTPDRRLLDALTTGMGKRKRSLGIVLSTQAEDDQHPLSQLIDDGLAGTDSSIVVDLTAAPPDADVFDEAVIRACNPALGIFLDTGTLMKEALQARRLPSAESAFRNLRCNQRISAAPDLLVTPSVWQQGDAPIDLGIFRDGRPVYGGLDLSARLDLTAMVLAAQDDAGTIHLMPLAWTPERTIVTRGLRDNVPYAAWITAGMLCSTPGLAIEYDYVLGDIAVATEGMNLVAVAYDSWNINALRQAAARVAFALPLVPFIQGFKSYTPAISAFEVECAEGRMRHGAHPVLRWCMMNTAIVRGPAGTPQQNRKPEKRRVNGRIDLAVAALMAVGSMKVTAAPEVDIAAMIA
jgi:phage terminase large subunit-like protein